MPDLCLPPRPFAKALHVSPRLGLAYVNNAKVACSTIKLALQRAELGDPDWQPPKSVHDHAGSPLLTFPEIEGQERQALAGKFVFSFVRNPYDRLRSTYLNKIVTGQKSGRPRQMAGFAADQLPSFEAFVLAVCQQDPSEQNPHWRMQAVNLSMDVIAYDFIGRLEEFHMDWPWLAGRFDLPFAPQRMGKTTAAGDKQELRFTPEMQDAVLHGYLPDFNLFGYDSTPPG